MRKTRRTGGLAVAASLALVAGGMAAVLPASAGPVKGPVGQLVLTTGAAGDKITYGADTQSLTTTGTCDLVTPSAEEKSLLGFTGSIGTRGFPIGFKDASIGVIETTDNSRSATLCNQVDAVFGLGSGPETLVLTLGSGLQFAGLPVQASKASLDLEVRAAGLFTKPKAQVQITAKSGGVNGTVVVPTFTVAQGSTACPAKDNENCQVEVVAPEGTYFDTLELRAAKGSFSLEGGSDVAIDPITEEPMVWPTQPVSPKPTTFDLVGLVDKVFECVVGNDVGVPESGRVTYVGSANPEDCVDFGATLNVGDGFVQFLKPLNVDPTAQFEVDVQWSTPGLPNGAVTLPKVVIDYEVGADPDPTTLEFCPPFVKKDATSEYWGISQADLGQLTDTYDQELQLDGVQFACIATRSANVSKDEVVTTDKVFLIGDAKLSRI